MHRAWRRLHYSLTLTLILTLTLTLALTPALIQAGTQHDSRINAAAALPPPSKPSTDEQMLRGMATRMALREMLRDLSVLPSQVCQIQSLRQRAHVGRIPVWRDCTDPLITPSPLLHD